jgi:hypothetical protein
LRQDPGFAWNHGDVSPDINTTWLGMVGPGVADVGIDATTWSDHSDIRPTILFLAGLKDDYQHQGRVLVEDLSGWAASRLAGDRGHFLQLARVYKQLEAPVGQLGLATLKTSTQALKSGSEADDSTYSSIESQLQSITNQRNGIGSHIIASLEGAEFGGKPIDDKQAKAMVDQANALLSQVGGM